MTKLSKSTLDTAHKLMEKHGEKAIYVKIKNGQMYFKETSAKYGLTDDEFEEQFEKVSAKQGKKEGGKKVDKAPPKQKGTTDTGGAGSTDKGADDALTALRAKYKEVFKKNPFNGWDAATLEEKIKEAGDSGDGNTSEGN